MAVNVLRQNHSNDHQCVSTLLKQSSRTPAICETVLPSKPVHVRSITAAGCARWLRPQATGHM